MEEEGRTITSARTHTHTSELPSSGRITHRTHGQGGGRGLSRLLLFSGEVLNVGPGAGGRGEQSVRGALPLLCPCPYLALPLPAPCPARPPHRALPTPNSRSLCMPVDASAAVPASNRVRRARADSGRRQRDAAPPLQRGTRGRAERLPAFSRPGPVPPPSARCSRPLPAQILRRPRARPRRWQPGFGVRRGLTRK